LTFDSNWRWVSSEPSSLEDGKLGLLEITSIGSNKTDIIAKFITLDTVEGGIVENPLDGDLATGGYKIKQDNNTYIQIGAGSVLLKDSFLNAAIPLSQTGTDALVGFTATSIIKALNELKAGGGAVTFDEVYDSQIGVERVINVDDENIRYKVKVTDDVVDNALFIEAHSTVDYEEIFGTIWGAFHYWDEGGEDLKKGIFLYMDGAPVLKIGDDTDGNIQITPSGISYGAGMDQWFQIGEESWFAQEVQFKGGISGEFSAGSPALIDEAGVTALNVYDGKSSLMGVINALSSDMSSALSSPLTADLETGGYKIQYDADSYLDINNNNIGIKTTDDLTLQTDINDCIFWFGDQAGGFEFYTTDGLNFKLGADGAMFFGTANGIMQLRDGFLSSPITLSQSGTTGLSGFTATSIIGALNELKAGGLSNPLTADLSLGGYKIKKDNDNYMEIDVDDNISFRCEGSLLPWATGNVQIKSYSGNVQFQDQYLSAAVTISETGVTGLSGFTATSIIGALNELKAALP